MNLEQKVKKIHDSNLFGNVIELGNGCCISNLLLSVEGASKTINKCIVPYSKESQKKYKFERSVAKESVVKILRTEMNKKVNKKINFCLVSSFQLQGEGQNNLTHGYIGYFSRNFIKVYHISIPKKLSRKKYFEIISEIGIDIMLDNENSCYIDGVYFMIGNTFCQGIEDTLKILIKSKEDNFIVLAPNNYIMRFEDLVRNKEEIVLMKGSFNPIHERHVEILEKAKKKYPNAAHAFISSIERYDKSDISIREIIKKAEQITRLGYYFVIEKKYHFDETVSWIRQRWEQKIIFPVGMDTINRWIETKDNKLKNFTNAKFLVFKRKNSLLIPKHKYFSNYFEIYDEDDFDDGISSTKIREGKYHSKLVTSFSPIT